MWVVLLINAQNDREQKFRVERQLAQSFGLYDWNSVKFASDRLPRATSSTDLRASVNLYVIKRAVGIFSDMGVGIMPAPRDGLSDPAEQAAFTSGIPYYTKEITADNGNQSASAHFKMTFGIFGKISMSDKLSVSPRFGGGFMTISSPSCKAVLKEHDSNMQYTAHYQWFGVGDYSYSNEAMLSYLTFRLRFDYRFAPKRYLLFGIEYTWFANRSDFTERYTNYFNYNLVRTINHKGNQLNMLGCSIGVSF
jgi:hypothetical protein